MLRKIVAEDKYLTCVDGMDLDLTYILPNLIAMGYPATGITKQWRNSKDQIAEYLEQHHAGNYMIWNLTEKPYPSEKFQNRVKHVGFLDHHPPRFNHLLKIVADIVGYMLDDNKHVSVVHCKAGRGRTGLICSCVLLAMGLCSDAKEALEFFAARRSKIMKGATSPPQIRYCYNFYYYLTIYPREIPFAPIPNYKLYLKSIAFFSFIPTIVSREFSDVPRPVVFFSPLSHSEAKPQLVKYPQIVKEIQHGNYMATFQDRVIQNDLMVTIALETRERTTVLGKILLQAFFLDANSIYTFGLDKMQDPTEGVNRNQFALPGTFQMKFHFGSSEPEDPQIEQLHSDIISFSKEYPLDDMRDYQPPPLPSKLIHPFSGSKYNINMSPRTKKKKAPPLPPKDIYTRSHVSSQPHSPTYASPLQSTPISSFCEHIDNNNSIL
ncbi:phosphatase [Entamoeba marina]